MEWQPGAGLALEEEETTAHNALQHTWLEKRCKKNSNVPKSIIPIKKKNGNTDAKMFPSYVFSYCLQGWTGIIRSDQIITAIIFKHVHSSRCENKCSVGPKLESGERRLTHHL